MMGIILTLVVLAAGATTSALIARRGLIGLRLGLATAGIAGALCIITGWTVLGNATPVRSTVEWPMPLGLVRLAVDGLSAWFLLVIGVVSIGVSIYSWDYFVDANAPGPVGAFAPLICTMIGAMVLVVSAADIVLFLVGWEAMSLSAFFLVGFHDKDPEARRGAWTYLISTHLGTALGVLPVFAAFSVRTGSTAMEAFTGVFDHSEVTPCVLIFILGLVGFGTKAGFIPFHVWLPVAHPVAPSPVSALMSGVVIKTGIYGFLRLLSWLPDLPAGCAIGLMIVALTTGLVGILYALGQRQVKRMLAYSSIENVGIVGVAISVALLGRSLQHPVLVAFGLAGALLHVLNHALFKGLLFLSAGTALHNTGTGDMERLGGLARHAPWNAMAFLIGSIAICALPPLNGFVSEFAIYAGILQGVVSVTDSHAALFAVCAVILALMGGLALVVFSKTFSVVFLGTQRDRNVLVCPTPASMNAGMLFLAMSCVATVFCTDAMLSAVSAAIAPFTSTSQHTEVLEASFRQVVRLLPLLGVLILVAIGIFAFRQRLPSGATAGGTGGTWGCGFSRPGPAMQYTGSSFVWKLIRSFRHIACSKRELRIPEKCFPARGELFTASTDLALERIYTPLFSGLARFFERLWPLQHGRIQLYLLYMVATVLTVFLIEKWSDCFPGHDALGQTIGVSDSEFEWRGQDCRFHPVFAQEGHHVE